MIQTNPKNENKTLINPTKDFASDSQIFRNSDQNPKMRNEFFSILSVNKPKQIKNKTRSP